MKKYSAFLNPQLFWTGLAASLLCIGMVVFFIVGSYVGLIRSNNNYGFRAVWYVLGLLYIGAMMICWPKWAGRIILSEGGIVLKIPFSSIETHAFECYPYVHRACYWHKSLIMPLRYRTYFIVLTRLKLSPQELENINAFNSNSDLIIIRYSKDVFDFLCCVLPRKQVVALQLEFHSLLTGQKNL